MNLHDDEKRTIEKSIMRDVIVIMAGLSAMAGVLLTVVVAANA